VARFVLLARDRDYFGNFYLVETPVIFGGNLMIKKPTLVVLVCAVILGGVAYYLNVKQNKPASATADTSKPAFSMQASDVTGLTLSRAAKPGEMTIRFEKKGGAWHIDQPVDTGADESSVDGIVDGVAGARVSETEPAATDRLKAFGLDPPEVSLEFELRNGTKHKLALGDKDITGRNVYGIVDAAKTVSLLPISVLTAADKSFDELRDRSVLPITSAQVASFELKNSSGEMEAAKQNNQWKFTKPTGASADGDAISSLLSSVENGRMAGITSEKPENLGKYGLASPSIVFTSTNDIGKKSTLLVGGKSGDDYYARDPSRPMTFTINGAVHSELAKTFGDLRDKKLAHFDPADISRVEIHNEHGTIVAIRKNETDWTIDSPASQKGKAAAWSKVIDPITAFQAQKVIDRPQPNVSLELAKPGIEVDLTDKNGKKITLKMTKPAGDLVYAQVSDSPSVYQLKKEDYDGLNLDASQAVQ
jgi:hypothetical protein